jgi:hypothetical protein
MRRVKVGRWWTGDENEKDNGEGEDVEGQDDVE